eukprot:m.123987 g.123987  ORF g.123987 m.123987 type:complete len:104 (+) comp13764_c2_seq5:254-565(+)
MQLNSKSTQFQELQQFTEDERAVRAELLEQLEHDLAAAQTEVVELSQVFQIEVIVCVSSKKYTDKHQLCTHWLSCSEVSSTLFRPYLSHCTFGRTVFSNKVCF